MIHLPIYHCVFHCGKIIIFNNKLKIETRVLQVDKEFKYYRLVNVIEIFLNVAFGLSVLHISYNDKALPYYGLLDKSLVILEHKHIKLTGNNKQ